MTVTNQGKFTGSHVLLVFLRPPRAAVAAGTHGDLQRKLVAYFRTPELGPGASQQFELKILTDDAKVFANETSEFASVPEVSQILLSDDHSDARWSVELYGGNTANETLRESLAILI